MIAFYRCMEERQIKPGVNEMPVIPAIVCISFATELYLKAVLGFKNLPKGKDGHSLKKLFNHLPEETKKLIRKNIRIPDWYFDRMLSDADTAFVDWRYEYEYEFHPEKSLTISTEFLIRFINEVRHFL
jgi:HEPN domain-containing protein